MKTPPEFRSFEVSPDDPLAAEHAAVQRWVEEAFNTLGAHRCYQDVDLKSLPSGQVLLAGNAEQSRRFVMAAVAQTARFNVFLDEVSAWCESLGKGGGPNFPSNWPRVWGSWRQTIAVISTLMRRALPFSRADVLSLVRWYRPRSGHGLSDVPPVGTFTRTLERYAAENTIDSELRDEILQLADRLRSAGRREATRQATMIQKLCGGEESGPEAMPSQTTVPPRPTPKPALAGSPNVLVALKRSLGLLSFEETSESIQLDPDGFELFNNSPLRVEHALLSELFLEVVGTSEPYRAQLASFEAGRQLLALEPKAMGRALLAAVERYMNRRIQGQIAQLDEEVVRRLRYAAYEAVETLIDCEFVVDRSGVFDLLLFVALLPQWVRLGYPSVAKLIPQVEQYSAQSPLSEGERYVLHLLRSSLVTGPMLGVPSKEVARLTALIKDVPGLYLGPGEAWADAVNEDIAAMKAPVRSAWVELLRHALSATSSRPSAKWLKTAAEQVKAIGAARVRRAFLSWLPLFAKGRSRLRLGDLGDGLDVVNDENATCLRGLLWCVPLLPKCEELTRTITAVAVSAYKKVPGIGPRAIKVGNAVIYVLSEFGTKEAVGQLAMLKVRVRFGGAQKEIEKAFDAAAAALDLPRDQIEELGVPSYGLEEVGRLLEAVGDYRAELIVTGSEAELKWFERNGKRLKSVPAKIKSEHKDELKELQQSVKDIQSMLPAQRDRIDSLFLLQKTWSIEEWKERYYDHPLVGTIARRLLWCVDGTPSLFVDGIPTDSRGVTIAHGKTAEITLWHPVGRTIEEVTGWRRRLEELGITQPFKQAYREVYLLTDAERNTNTYSNRFAAHVIRQHQFNALCAARGWKNKLRLLVDSDYPPATKELPLWGLRAEFWVEGIGQVYGIDTNDTGTFWRLATDQVRFYRQGAAMNRAHAGGGGFASLAAGPGEQNINEPIPLEDVPALVFSEVMRDVDLFVGVASVGNDPTWQDGGPQGRYREYWQNYSFGELSGTAATRKQVLTRLVPRLKIASRCSIDERFLIVRGDIRTYKIHLGSGNILMEPNDQYLCIVPDSQMRASQGDLYLPFEGDATLSIIISKAFLLAEDTKIKDPTITRQIKV